MAVFLSRLFRRASDRLGRGGAAAPDVMPSTAAPSATALSTPPAARNRVRPRRAAQAGFSLLEVLLAVSIAIGLGSLQLSQLRRDAEYTQANAVGQQLEDVGQALNSYVTLHYGQLTALTSVAGAGTAADPGPRTCNAATGMCTITAQTLILNGLLPQSFSGVNAYGANYLFYIYVQGAAPDWQVDGMVVTSTPYATGATTRFDLIGQAMQTAGADSGTTRTVANQINGYDGSWLDTTFATAPGYPNQLGLLAYRVGYGTSGFSAYLRLDGTTPMTGDLNMYDGTTYHNIVGANNITAQGAVTGGSFVTQAANAAAVILGASNAANQTTLGNNGNSLAVTNAGGVQFVNSSNQGTPITAGNMTVGAVTSSSTGTFNGALQAASFTSTSGNITSAADVTAASNVIAGGNISTTGGNIFTTNGNISAGGSGQFASVTVGGSDTFSPNNWVMGNGGGWVMTNTTTMQVMNNKNLYTGGTVEGGTLQTDQDLDVARFVNITGTNAVGAGCTVGQLSRDAVGHLLQCVSGVFRTATYSTITSVTSGAGTNVTASCAAGYTLLSGGFVAPAGGAPAISEMNAGLTGWNVQSGTGNPSTFEAVAYCAQ